MSPDHRRIRVGRPLGRCVLVSSALLLLIAFGAFTARPVNPYVSSGSNAWHVSKASKSAEPGVEGAGEIPALAHHPQLIQDSSSEGTPLPDPEVHFLMLPRLLHTHYFRPPPSR